MKALILATGESKRPRDIVSEAPNPMAVIAGKPFLEHQILSLKNYGLEDIVLCLYHQSETIKSYFGDGIRMNVNITYSEEDIPFGTASAINNSEKYIDKTFLVLNGNFYADAN